MVYTVIAIILLKNYNDEMIIVILSISFSMNILIFKLYTMKYSSQYFGSVNYLKYLKCMCNICNMYLSHNKVRTNKIQQQWRKHTHVTINKYIVLIYF